MRSRLDPSHFHLPAQIIIVRHGEKLKHGNELNERGWERAHALVDFIKHNKAANRFGEPVAIFATKPHSKTSSIRMIQTMLPLAQEIEVPVEARFERTETKRLARAILSRPWYGGKTIVICWQSETIPDLVKALGLKHGPKEWDCGYDRAWILRYRGGRLAAFKDVAQNLLAGDTVS